MRLSTTLLLRAQCQQRSPWPPHPQHVFALPERQARTLEFSKSGELGRLAQRSRHRLNLHRPNRCAEHLGLLVTARHTIRSTWTRASQPLFQSAEKVRVHH